VLSGGDEGGSIIERDSVVKAETENGVTGQIVVYNDIVSVVTEPILAGQSVTVL
jgi:hypothetical protein